MIFLLLTPGDVNTPVAVLSLMVPGCLSFLVALTGSMTIQFFWTPVKSTVRLVSGLLEQIFPSQCMDSEQQTLILEFLSSVAATLFTTMTPSWNTSRRRTPS